MPEIDKIILEVEGKATESTKGIDSLIIKLGNLDSTITSVNPQLNALRTSFKGVSSSASSLSNINFTGTVRGIEQLGKSLNTLNIYSNNMKNMQMNLKGVSSGINSMKRAMTSLGEASPNIEKVNITGITSQMQELSKLGKLSESFITMKEGAKAFNSGINTMNKAADKFPDMMKKINNLDLTKFKVQVKELATVMGTFTQTINSTATSLTGFSKAVTGLPSSVSKATSAVTKAQKGSASSFNTGGIFGIGGGVNLLSNLFMLKQIGNAFGYTLKKANDFIETMNLFGVVMGENTQKANEFQEQIQVLGVDREQSMRFQSSFYDIGKSLGMTSRNAYTLSEQFTKLGYDYASLYNIPIEQSFEKLQSGIVGSIRPLRELGKDISEAKLKETALTLGIEENVRNMAQSDKAMLRFITLMRQSGSAMNDMERTLYTPANALRVLKAQFTSLARELGNIFIPILTAVLPYLIAISKFLRGIIADIASFFGIKMFELDFSGINTSMGIADDYSSDLADNLDDGANSAKKIKDYMLGIDELNVLNTDTGTINKDKGAAGVGGVGGVLDNFDLEDFGYDDLFKGIDDKSKSILDTLNKWKIPLLAISSMLATMWAVGKIYNFIRALKNVQTTSALAAGAQGIGKLTTSFFGLAGTGGILGSVATGFVVLGDKVLMAMGIMTGSVTIAGLVGLGIALSGVALASWGIYEAMKPSIESIDVLGSGISDITKNKMKPFVDTFQDLQKELTKIDFTGVITDEDITSITSKVDSMVQAVVTELDSDKNQELADLNMLKGLQSITSEQYDKMLSDAEEYYTHTVKETEDAQKEIEEILSQYQGNELVMTEEHKERLKILNGIIMNNAVAAMSESAKEQEIILNRLKYNEKALTVQAGSEILVEAKKNYDAQMTEAEDWKARMMANLDKKRYEEETITQEEYEAQKKIIDTAYGDMTKNTQATYDDISKKVKTGMGDQYKYIDEGSGEIKASWKVWLYDLGQAWDDFWGGLGTWYNGINQGLGKWWNGIESEWVQWNKKFGENWDRGFESLKTWYQSKIDGLGKWFNGIGDKFNEWKKGFGKMWDDFWGGLGTWWDETKLNPGNWFGGGKSKMAMGIDFIANNSINPPLAFARGGFVPQSANFISPDSWTAGEEGRKELIGSYKGRTTVMPLENTSFVSTMYQAVYDAVRDASQQNEITVLVQPKVQLDSKDIAQGQEEYKFKSGGGLIKKR